MNVLWRSKTAPFTAVPTDEMICCAQDFERWNYTILYIKAQLIFYVNLVRWVEVLVNVLIYVFQKWRPFCMEFEKEIEDYSFATLVRLDANDEYSEPNTLLVTRIQFFCIEIARNREGNNDKIRTLFKPKPRTKNAQK